MVKHWRRCLNLKLIWRWCSARNRCVISRSSLPPNSAWLPSWRKIIRWQQSPCCAFANARSIRWPCRRNVMVGGNCWKKRRHAVPSGCIPWCSRILLSSCAIMCGLKRPSPFRSQSARRLPSANGMGWWRARLTHAISPQALWRLGNSGAARCR